MVGLIFSRDHNFRNFNIIDIFLNWIMYFYYYNVIIEVNHLMTYNTIYNT